MASIPESAFVALLGRLDAEQFRDFVATVWAARGHDVTRDGERIVVESGDDRVVIQALPGRVLPGVRPLGGPSAEDVTTVVAAGSSVPRWARDSDLRVVDGAELHDVVLYGIPASERDALFETFFGRSSAARPADDMPLASVSGRLPDAVVVRLDAAAAAFGSPAARALVTVGLAAVVVLSLVVGAGLLGGSGGPSGSPTPATATASPTLAPLQDVRTATPSPSSGGFPSGVNESGITNTSRLAVSHVGNVSDESFTMTFAYRESGPNHTALARERILVASQTRYVTDVRESGSFETDPWPVADVAAYADGQHRYERFRRNGSVRYRSTPVYTGHIGRVERRAAALLTVALGGAETTLADRFHRDGTTLYRIRFDNGNGSGIRNSTGTLVVDEDGVVRSLQWTFERAESGLTVTIVMRVGAFGETAVRAPEWVDDAKNATRG